MGGRTYELGVELLGRKTAVAECDIQVRLGSIRCQYGANVAEQVNFRKSKWGLYYAELHNIPLTGAKGNRSPFLRAILVDDLGCEHLREVEGDEGIYLDFSYKQRKFTCELIDGRSELYPASATQSTQTEQELLRELAPAIVRHAEERLCR